VSKNEHQHGVVIPNSTFLFLLNKPDNYW